MANPTGQPWYTYPSDAPGGGYGQIGEPLNPSYLKPDTNIAIPAGVPITSWDGGVITDVSNKGFSNGGLSVTMRLNHPINANAQYASFNYLGSPNVHVGQVVYPGTQIGIAGSPTGINFALGLGNTPSWGTGSFPQGTGDPNYNPNQVLISLNKGQTPSGNAVGSLLSAGGAPPLASAFISVGNRTHEILNNIPGFVGIVDALDSVETFVPFTIQNDAGTDLGIIGHLPFIGGIAQAAAYQVTLPYQSMQAFLTFVTANTLAAFVRLILIMAGVVIIIALIMNAIGTTIEETTGQSAGSLASQGIKLAALAA